MQDFSCQDIQVPHVPVRQLMDGQSPPGSQYVVIQQTKESVNFLFRVQLKQNLYSLSCVLLWCFGAAYFAINHPSGGKTLLLVITTLNIKLLTLTISTDQRLRNYLCVLVCQIGEVAVIIKLAAKCYGSNHHLPQKSFRNY